MPTTRALDATRRNSFGRRSAQPKRDPGAYIGRLPERATETLPDGPDPRDERVAAVVAQPGPVRGPEPAAAAGSPPEGHREATFDRDDTRREAGERR
jgi:hypothetical protein